MDGVVEIQGLGPMAGRVRRLQRKHGKHGRKTGSQTSHTDGPSTEPSSCLSSLKW